MKITIENVKKRYGHYEALRGVSLEVGEGDFLVIVGENGAGKSTLLKIMAGLVTPTSGRVLIDGVPLNSANGEIRGRLGVVIHQSCLYPSLSAYKNLQFFGRLFSVDHIQERIERVLARVRLLDRKDDPVSTYSCGMKQRLAIARALLHDPSILLLDEPFSGLDPRAVDDLKTLLLEFKEEGRTVVMVTHNLREGYELSERLAIMAKGRLVHLEERSSIPWERFQEVYYSAGVMGSVLP